MKRAATLLSVLLCGATALAQSFLVVPPGYDATEARSMGTIAGFQQRYRQQFLVKGADLAPMQGKTLLGVWLRRDATVGTPNQAASAALNVQMSHAAMPSQAPATTLAWNRGSDATLVFSGTISLPATPAVTQPPAPWAAPHAIRIGLQAPFVYQGGDLCLEIDGDPLSPRTTTGWWVDYEYEADVGVVQYVGNACGDVVSSYPTPATASGANLVPGSTFCLVSYGRPNTPAILILGQPAVPPMSLDPLQATGCTLYVQPQVVLQAGFYVWPHSAGLHPFYSMVFPMDIPASPAFLTVRFFAQWANLETGGARSNPAGFTTTNALDLTTGQRMPRGSISRVVTAGVPSGVPFPATGRVDVSRGPVLRFEYQ